MEKNKTVVSGKNIMFSAVVVLAAAFCCFLQGCATTKLPHTYRIEGREYKNFDSLDDEDALKAVVMTYNATVETGPEETAKVLTLQLQVEKLKKRKSEYVNSSGVFEMIVFEKTDLKVWSEEDLLRVYNDLRQRFVAFSGVRVLNEEENAKKIIYVVGMQSLVNELERRENTRQARQVISQLLSAALSTAVSLI